MRTSRKAKTKRTPSKRKARGSLNQAATGIFEPSENPEPHLRRTTLKVEKAIDELRNEVESQQHSGPARQGQVEDRPESGPRDKIVGPDISQSPFSKIPPHRRPAA